MTNTTTVQSGGGLGLATVLTIVFVVLKLTGNIAWSWWWVFSPILISWALFLLIVLIGLTVLAVMRARETDEQRRARKVREALKNYSNR